MTSHVGFRAMGASTRAVEPQRYVALLRGVNVGGRNVLPMRALAAIFQRAGASDVRTYIQSGNVVFSAPVSKADEITARVRTAMESEFDLRSPVVLRSREEFAQAIRSVPFASSDSSDAASIHVGFLEREPSADAVRALDPERSPGDSFEVVGREVYLWTPRGIARTKLTNHYFDRTLNTVSTMRNWRTVTKLAELLETG